MSNYCIQNYTRRKTYRPHNNHNRQASTTGNKITHSLIHSFTHCLTHSLTHSFTHSLPQGVIHRRLTPQLIHHGHGIQVLISQELQTPESCELGGAVVLVSKEGVARLKQQQWSPRHHTTSVISISISISRTLLSGVEEGQFGTGVGRHVQLHHAQVLVRG